MNSDNDSSRKSTEGTEKINRKYAEERKKLKASLEVEYKEMKAANAMKIKMLKESENRAIEEWEKRKKLEGCSDLDLAELKRQKKYDKVLKIEHLEEEILMEKEAYWDRRHVREGIFSARHLLELEIQGLRDSLVVLKRETKEDDVEGMKKVDEKMKKLKEKEAQLEGRSLKSVFIREDYV